MFAPLTYAAGVSIGFRNNVFGGISDISYHKDMDAPIQMSSTDSVGTKVKEVSDFKAYNLEAIK